MGERSVAQNTAESIPLTNSVQQKSNVLIGEAYSIYYNPSILLLSSSQFGKTSNHGKKLYLFLLLKASLEINSNFISTFLLVVLQLGAFYPQIL